MRPSTSTTANTATRSRAEPSVKAWSIPVRRTPSLLVGLFFALVVVATPRLGAAANWTMIQGTEEPFDDRRLALYGFVQPLFETIIADDVEGLSSESLSPYNGRPMVLNTLSAGDVQSTFSIRRARVGLRGRAPGVADLVSYHFSMEAGMNALTGGGGVALIDAAVTLSSPWGPRLRFGQFRLATADEAQEAVHVSADLINFSPIVPRLLLERPVDDGVVGGRAYGFRDIGLELFDAPKIGEFEFGYSAWVTNGRMGSFDVDRFVDVGARLQLSWLLDERRYHPERDELSFAVWGLTGKRTPRAGIIEQRTRAGATAQLRLAPLRLRGEVLWGEGVIPGGPSPPFRGNPVGLLDDATAYGANALASLRVRPWLEGTVAIHHMVLSPLAGPAERIFWEGIFGVQFFASPHAKLALNAALRKVAGPEAPADVQRILSTVGPRLSAQATVRF